MACTIKLKNGNLSLLHEQLLKIFKNEEEAERQFNRFNSEIFLNNFGDYKEYRDTLDVSYIDPNFKNRLTDTFEPLVSQDTKGFYYLDKQYTKQYIKYNESELYNIFKSESKVNRLVEILGNYFIKNGGFNLDFDTLDMSELKSEKSLKHTVINKMEKLGDRLLNSPNDNVSLNGGSILDTVDNPEALDELITKITEYFTINKLKYSEEPEVEKNLEFQDDDSVSKDPLFSRSSFEVNTKDKISANIRLRLSLITDTSKSDLQFGEPVPLAFDEVYNKLITLLQDKVALIKNGVQEDLFQIYIDELSKHTKYIPYLKDVVTILDKINKAEYSENSKEYRLNQNLKASFVRAMTNSKNSFNITSSTQSEIEISPQEVAPRLDENGDIAGFNLIKEAVIEKHPTVEVFDATATNKLHLDIVNNWNLSLEQYFFEDSSNVMSENKFEELKDIREKLKNYRDTKHYKGGVMYLKELYKKFNIDLSDDGFNYGVNELLFDIERSPEFYTNKYNEFLTENIKLFHNLPSLKTKKEKPFDAYVFKQYATAEAYYREDGSEITTYSGGKTKQNLSTPSYLSIKLNEWKKSRDELFNQFQNSGSWIKSSKLLNHLLKTNVADSKVSERDSKVAISKLKLSSFSLFQTKKDTVSPFSQKDGKQISKSEYFADTINKLLYSIKKEGNPTISRTVTAPGKSTQYELQHDYFFKSGIFIRNDEVVIPPKNIKLIREYVNSEFERMHEAFKTIQDDKQLTSYYHTDKGFNVYKDGKLVGNAFKFQILPELNSLDLFNDDGSLNQYKVTLNSEKIDEIIENSIKSKLDVYLQKMIDENVIEQSSEKLFNNKAIDFNIWSKYKGLDNKVMYKSQMYGMVGDIFMNGLINQIEYSKLFSGDVAYYKDSVDYIKRIGETYMDGIRPYINDDNKEITIAVVESVNIKEPYREELFEVIKDDLDLIKKWEEEVNSADAQAWTTIDRWRDILEGVGLYSETHHSTYLKIKNNNLEGLTKEELKTVMQPIKGGYYNLIDGKPVYLKYSLAVLIPQLRKNNGLDKLYQMMKAQNVQELITFDGIKAGSPIPSKVHDENGNVVTEGVKLNTLTIPAKGWSMVQQLPTKTIKETDIGSQIQNNMLLFFQDTLGSDEKSFTLGDESLTSLELMKVMDSTAGSILSKGFDTFLKDFGVNQDGTIENIDKFYKSILDDYREKGNQNAIKALEVGLSIYGIPGIKTKLDNVFAAIVNDRLIKLQTNGGSFIQMSNFGLSKSEADKEYSDGIKWSPLVNMGDTIKPYRYLKNSKGEIITDMFGRKKIAPEQVLISGSFIAKYIPDYRKYSSEKLFGTFNEETGLLEGGMIDSKILDSIIGYRIPNQGPSSNGALQVAGILPEGSGDTIVAFTGITSKTGSDFDIDKMYVMFPNYKVRTNIKSESYKYLKEKFKGDNIKETVENLKAYFEDLTDSEFNEDQLAEQLHSNEGRVEFLKGITDSLVDLILKNQKNPQIAEIIKDLNIKPIGLTYIKSNSDNLKSLQNKLIEVYKTTMLHESNMSKMMTPLDHVFVKMDAQNIAPPVDKDNFDIFDAFMDIDTKYSFLAGLAGVGQLANAFSDYAMGTASDYYLRNVNISSKYANTDMQIGDVYDHVAKTNVEHSIEHTSFDKKNCVTLTDKELSDWVNSFNSRSSKKIDKVDFEYLKTIPISDTLSAVMNAFVDIAKDPYITNVQWNMMTTNVGNLLVRAGLHPFRVLSFIAQPVIGEYIEFVSQYENNDKRNQVRDTKTEFQHYKVGQLLQNHRITVDDNGTQINAKIIYDEVTSKLPKDVKLKSEMFNIKQLAPIIRDRLNLTFNDRLITNFNDNELKYILDQHYLYFSEELKNNPLNYDLKNLRAAIFENSDIVQASVFNAFLSLLNDSKKMKSNVDASKFGVKGMGKNTTELLMVLNRVGDVQNKQVEGFDSKMYHTDGKPKLLGHRYEVLQKVANLINKNPNLFVSANQSVWNSYNLISNMIYGKPLENEELADKLEKTFYTYLISGFEPFKLSASEKINLIDNLPKKFNEFKGKYKQDYYILDQLQVKPGEKRNYIGIANKNNSKEYVDRMVNSWNELLKYHPEFATELIQYSFVTSGFNLGLNTFYNYIPPSFMLQNGFNDYIKYYSNTVDLIDNSFIDHFFLNNLDDSQIVKYVDRNSVNLEKSKKYGTLAIVLNENAGRFIKIGTEYYQNINNVDGEFVYSPYIKVKGGFSKIKPLSVKDKKGFSVYNFSAGNISLSAETLKDDVVKALTDIFNDSEVSNEVIQPASNLLENNIQPINDNLEDTTGKQLTLFEPLNEEEQQKLKEINEICKPKK